MQYKGVRVYFRTNDTKRWHLDYRLFENNFVERWSRALSDALAKPALYQSFDSDLYGKYFLNRSEIVDSINRSISIVNAYGHEQINMRASEEMGPEFLNELHHTFEKLVIAPEFQPDRAGNDVYSALKTINVEIHRFESFFFDTHKGFIITRTDRTFSAPLTAEDLRLFTPNNRWGYLYLPYQTVGISPLNGFFNKIDHQPTPQTHYTASLHMSFDIDREFSLYDEYKRWMLEEKGMNPEDPKIPMGLIPLGALDSEFSKEEVETNLYKTIAVDEIVLLGKDRKLLRPKTHWPCGNLLEEHLNFKPFVQIPLRFEYAEVLKEAQSLVDKFVVHRSYDQSSDSEDGPKWKSLAIQTIDGDSTKTEPYSVYRDYEGSYFLTEIAEHIPKTIETIQTLTDLKQCQRIRFMLLDPGAAIRIHNDGPDRLVSAAWNIAINNPKGCRFHIDLDADGTENPYSREIPFLDGTCFLINVSKNHYVVNESKEPRFHIIVHGPSRYDSSELARLAQEQLGIKNRRELLTKLYRKNLRFIPTPAIEKNREALHKKWASQGLGLESIPEDIRLVVVNFRIRQNELLENEVLHRFTKASLFPLKHDLVECEHLEEHLAKLHDEGIRGVAIIASGNFFLDLYQFIPNLFEELDGLIDRQETIAAHLNHPTNEDLAIFAHEQFVLLNLALWAAKGAPKIGPRYGGLQKKYMPAKIASPVHVHDDYTPTWVKPYNEAPAKFQRFNWGSNVIAASLRAGETVRNIGLELRASKVYTYPDSGDSYHLDRVREKIQQRIDSDKNFVYFFNNEPLRIAKPKNFKPSSFFFVAAGFKPHAILQQFEVAFDQISTQFVDFSQPALDYLLHMPDSSFDDLVDYIANRMESDRFLGDQAKDQVQRELLETIQGRFKGSFTFFFQSIRKLRESTHSNFNFVLKPESFIQLLEVDKKTLFWHSNAWDTNSLRFQLSEPEIQESYENFGRLLAEYYQAHAWRRVGGFDLIVGKSFDSPQFYATGAAGPEFPVEISQFEQIT